MEARRDVFQAIADPNRREIIRMIAQKPTNVNTIAEHFNISRQAISLHLKILSECGLIIIKQSGRERLCEVKLEKLNEVHEWVQQYQKLWERKLKALKTFVEQDNLSSKKIGTITKKIITPKKIKNGKSHK